MKVILCGGGTAGHIHPAIAIAEILKEKEAKADILFIGREGGKENRAVKRARLKIKTLEVSGLKRQLSVKNIKSLYLAFKARFEAEKIIKEFTPDIIIGTGGYVCYPVIRAGQRLGIRTVIHESNAVAGLTTRLLSTKCDKVMLGYRSAGEKLKRKDNIAAVGTPIRKDFKVISRQRARKLLKIAPEELLIVSFGGSLGAFMMNNACVRLMKNYSAEKKKIKHIHSLGDRFYESCKEDDFKRGRDGCKLVSYIDNMPTVLAAADIAITRAGALTLSELIFSGVASVLIPSPGVTDDHQTKNAKELSDAGAAITVKEGENLYEELLTAVRSLAEDDENRLRLKRRIELFQRNDTNEKIYREIKKLI